MPLSERRDAPLHGCVARMSYRVAPKAQPDGDMRVSPRIRRRALRQAASTAQSGGAPLIRATRRRCWSGRIEMIAKATFVGAVCTLAMIGVAGTAAHAQDLLKVAVPQRGSWDAGLPELGKRGGIFKKHGLDLEI